MLETFTAATFAPHVGEVFRLHVERGGPSGPLSGVASSAEVVLVECAALPMVSAGPERAPFSIVFRGPAVAVLPQRIYGISHPDLGEFDLFLVPIAAGVDGVLYEAVFT